MLYVYFYGFSACLTNRNSKQHKIENEKQIWKKANYDKRN